MVGGGAVETEASHSRKKTSSTKMASISSVFNIRCVVTRDKWGHRFRSS